MSKRADIWQGLEDMGNYLKDAAEAAAEVEMTVRAVYRFSLRMEELKKAAEADRLLVSQKLRREFMTPMEREDMYALWEGGFRLLEEMNQTAALLYFCQKQDGKAGIYVKSDADAIIPDCGLSQMQQLLRHISTCCRDYGAILQEMRNFQQGDLWEQLNQLSKRLEEGKKMYWDAVTAGGKRSDGPGFQGETMPGGSLLAIRLQMMHQIQLWLMYCGNAISSTKLILLKNV